MGYGEQIVLITLKFSSLTTFGDFWRSCTALKLYADGFVAKSIPTLATPWTVDLQAPLSLELSRQEYLSGLPFASSGDLLDPGIEPKSLAL